MPLIILTIVALLSAPAAAFAQAAAIDGCDSFKTRIDRIAAGEGDNVILDLLDPDQGARCYAEFVVERFALIDVIRRFESSRSDKQSGTAGDSGSTSVVSQGPVAKVLSAAVEYGAFTQSVDKQVITIRGNAAGLPSALIRHNIVPYCVPQDRSSGYCIDKSALGVLRRVSFAVAFNAIDQTQAVGTPTGAATPSGQPVVFEASKNQVASASVRVQLSQHRDASSEAFRKKWTATVGKSMSDVSKELASRASDFAEPIKAQKEYEGWKNKHLARIKAAGKDRDAIVDAFQAALAELYPIMQAAVPDTREKALRAVAAYNAFFTRQDEVIDEVANKDVLAVEYTNSRPTSKPHTSNVRFIWDAPFKDKHKFVGNVAVTWYDESQVNTDGTATKYRDAQAGLQYEHGLGDLAIIGPATLSFAFYYQYQHAPALLTVDPLKPLPGLSFVNLPDGAKTVFAEKGNIVLGQVKLSLTPKESNVKVPIAVTYSTRTELIDKPTWRAQLGVTYDFDSLFARSK